MGFKGYKISYKKTDLNIFKYEKNWNKFMINVHTNLYFGYDVCYFDDGVLSDGDFALSVHLAVHPRHAFSRALLHGAHLLHIQMHVPLVLGWR